MIRFRLYISGRKTTEVVFSVCPVRRHVISASPIWVVAALATWFSGECGLLYGEVTLFPFVINKYFVGRYFLNK